MVESLVLQEQKPAQPSRDFLSSAMIWVIEWPLVRRLSSLTVAFSLTSALSLTFTFSSLYSIDADTGFQITID